MTPHVSEFLVTPLSRMFFWVDRFSTLRLFSAEQTKGVLLQLIKYSQLPIIEKIPPQKTVWINIFFPLTNQTVYCYHKNLGIIDDFSPHIWTLSTSNPVCAGSMCTEQVFQRKNYENCHLIPRCIKCVKYSIMPKPNFGFKIYFSVLDDRTIIF